MKTKKIFWILLLISSFLFLSGCQSSILNPKGYVSTEQSYLILTSFFMMLLIIVPVIFMTLFFIWKYRSSNINAQYSPNWDKSHRIEILIWTIPILIIFFLAYLSWISTYKLEPSKPIHSLIKPIEIDVVALDWKWLFIYPEYDIATVNEVSFPIETPIIFRVTSNSVMNSFFIPALGSQIYAMAGMQTKVYLLANESGSYKGFSANYSGSGFSDMKFSVLASKNRELFNTWIKNIKKSPYTLNTMKMFHYVAESKNKVFVQYFSHVNRNLFLQIMSQFKK
ncbi:ubiquinol oxidase subunit II [Buchnera aphidicola]|uniref:ubiquinol oxidase subunit II n=1 Tax=Buchnera aphidicola TaxID=9 RepID=UPI00346412E2